MKNLKTYKQFLAENYSDSQLSVGDYVVSLDGYSGMIISQEISNGRIQYRDNKGVIHICDNNQVKRVKSIKDKNAKLEEEATMVGTGTLSPTSGPDQNIKTPGYSNSTDSASNGSYPVY